MSKYNVGDKFLIKIDQVVKCDNSDPVELFKIKGFNSLVFDEYGLDKLPQVPIQTHTCRDTESDKEKAYEAGLKDAWEAARKIGCTPPYDGLTRAELKGIFGTYISSHILKAFEAAEAVQKIKSFEAEKVKIHVGDVLEHKKWGIRVVVTKVNELSFQSINTSTFEFVKGLTGQNWEKTGQHFDLNEIFQVENEEEFPFN